MGELVRASTGSARTELEVSNELDGQTEPEDLPQENRSP
jgi:hypothetical protein